MKETTLVVLVHGFFKGKSDMFFLEKGISEAGYDVISVDLPTTFGSLEQCFRSMSLQVHDRIEKYSKVHFVAHSMGGLITRRFINRVAPNNIGTCVFIATPHKGSALADILGRIPPLTHVFRSLPELETKSCEGQIVLDASIRVGAIAGTKNNLFFGKIFLSSESDGRVEVSSVSTVDTAELILLPFGHHEIHHQQQTLDYVKTFLGTGSFEGAAGRWPGQDRVAPPPRPVTTRLGWHG